MNQAKSLTGIYERQVLDNLAMFSQNPDALPFFAIPKAGSAQVTDSGAISASPLNGPIHTALSLTSLSRGNAETWTLEPVSDPAKLRRMRCAYRRALGYSFKECNKCCQLQEDWENKKRSGKRRVLRSMQISTRESVNLQRCSCSQAMRKGWKLLRDAYTAV